MKRLLNPEDEKTLEAFDGIHRRMKQELEYQFNYAMQLAERREIAERRARRLMVLCGVLAIAAAWGWLLR